MVELKPFGPAQIKPEPPGVEFTVMGAEVTAQVKVAPVAAKTGGVVLPVTTAVAVAVQPVVPLVTVTV